MKKILTTVCMLAMLTTGAVKAQVANYNVVPLPKSVTLPTAPGFVLNEQVQIIFDEDDQEMERNAHFLADYVKEMTQLKLACQPERIASVKMKKLLKDKELFGNILLVLDPTIANKEGYVLDVAAKNVVLRGSTPAGVFLGIQTLRKALPLLSQKPEAVSLPAVTIQDEPRFAYRGMHLDCGRHFFSVEFVKEFIDLIALHGMNRFHWHLTEDQGWRFESKKYPKLTTIGAWRTGTVIGRNAPIDDGQRHGGFYTQEECLEIVQYAADRYITIIPEIDMPGHMLAALASYPELGCTGGPYEVEHTWGVFPDVLCPGKEKTFQFVQDVLDEVIAIFPSEYIHIGGDECPRDRWKVCPNCQKRITDEGIVAEGKQSKEDRLQGYFTKRVEKYLHEKGKKLIGWDELLGCNVDATATIMSWRGAEPGARAAKLGHDVIMTPNKPMYFDHYQTDKQWNEPLSIGGNSTVADVYAFEPIAADLTAEEGQHILGVQANVWTEYIGANQHVEYQILPRMAALAEVQWLQPEQKDFNAFKQRVTRLKAIYDMHKWVVAPHLFR